MQKGPVKTSQLIYTYIYIIATSGFIWTLTSRVDWQPERFYEFKLWAVLRNAAGWGNRLTTVYSEPKKKYKNMVQIYSRINLHT